MKNLILFALITCTFALQAEAQTSSNAVIYETEERGDNQLTLEINKLKSDVGKIMIELMDEDEKTIAYTTAIIKDGQATTAIPSLPSGTYALRYFHDQNNNDELDFNAMGIPKEGHGCSNDARGFMGPPAHKDMLFDLEGDMTIKMKTIH